MAQTPNNSNQDKPKSKLSTGNLIVAIIAAVVLAANYLYGFGYGTGSTENIEKANAVHPPKSPTQQQANPSESPVPTTTPAPSEQPVPGDQPTPTNVPVDGKPTPIQPTGELAQQISHLLAKRYQ